jgi:hypothetical protein
MSQKQKARSGLKKWRMRMANEKQTDLISRSALIAEYDRVHIGPPGGARKLMVDAPTVDAVEVVRGRWKFLDIDGWWFDECSICGNTTPNRDGSTPDWNYCPNCGAKMDGGNEDA